MGVAHWRRIKPRPLKAQHIPVSVASTLGNKRLDAYLEYGLRLWDIAAGGLILECAGGEHWHRPLAGEHTYEIIANNGRLRRRLEELQRRVTGWGVSSFRNANLM